MGYSTSPFTIKRVEKFLKEMVTTEHDLAWPTKNAHMVSYYIRQALTVAKTQGIDPYNTLKDRFIIRNRGDKVVAELRDLSTSTEALKHTMSQMTISDARSTMEIVGACITNKTAEQLHFPNASLTKEELKTLYKWISETELYLIVSDVEGITILKNNPGAVAWTPESL